jgi:hypothetical protein
MSSEILRCVAVVRIDVLEESVASIIRVQRMSELGTLAVTLFLALILFTLMMDATRSSETFVLTRATRRHIP